IADSVRTMVLRETRHLPVFYFPRADIRMEKLKATDHITHCPVKGNVCYKSINRRAPGRERDLGLRDAARFNCPSE
ncbi:MAG: DUF427 domain-containing protein, partial [Pseudomonadota bacterium]|nr:DUF427 domain-containing protein [Pseudomonadota bacterium]